MNGAGGAEDETRAQMHEPQQIYGGDDLSHVVPGGRRPSTGDDAVDEALAQLDAVADQPLDTQIAVGEQLNRILQGRLTDLGKE